jgi:hypothetical protein
VDFDSIKLLQMIFPVYSCANPEIPAEIITYRFNGLFKILITAINKNLIGPKRTCGERNVCGNPFVSKWPVIYSEYCYGRQFQAWMIILR